MKFIAKIKIDDAIRAELLKRFRPAQSNVFCRQITLAYGVRREYALPQGPVNVVVVARMTTDEADALMILIDGQRYSREDGCQLFITLSTAPGKQPSTPRFFDWTQAQLFDECIEFQATPVLEPVGMMKPTRELVAA